jgi:mRNA-degrading endonuclease RelE of RelBE toxin-antitoxin system
MVDRIQKALNNLSPKERKHISLILGDIRKGEVNDYDVKKLKGHDGIYRVRKGSFRIIYRITKEGEIFVLAIE